MFAIDRRAGSAPVQHLYYLPIVAASLGLGRFLGITTSLVAILLYQPRESRSFHERIHRLGRRPDNALRGHRHRYGELFRGRAPPAPLAMFVIDVDRLKSINDAHGHLAGSEAVRLVGHTLAKHLPSEAVACRYGGDEFAVAVSSCGDSHARSLAEELRGSIHALAPVLVGRSFPRGTLSISVGIASLNTGACNSATDVAAGEALFASADHALYAAKKRGRNRTHINGN